MATSPCMIEIELPSHCHEAELHLSSSDEEVKRSKSLSFSIPGGRSCDNENDPLLRRDESFFSPEESHESESHTKEYVPTQTFFESLRFSAEIEGARAVLLGLPFVFSRIGFVAGVALLSSMGLFVTASLKWKKCGVKTFLSSSMTNILLAISHFGFLVATQVLLRDILASIVNLQHLKSLVLGVLLLVSSPFWLLTRAILWIPCSTLTGRSFRSVFDSLSFGSLGVILSTRAYQKVHLPHAHQPYETPSPWLSNVFLTAPILLMCFPLHTSRLPYPPRWSRDARLVWQLVIACSCVGACGYAFAGQESSANIWLNFDANDSLALVGKTISCLSLWLSIPHTLRQSLLTVMEILRCRSNLPSNHETDSQERHGIGARHRAYCTIMDDDDVIMKGEQDSFGCLRYLQAGQVRSSTCAVLLLLLSYIAAFSVTRVEVIWSFLGYTAGLWLFFTIPAACHFQSLIDHDAGGCSSTRSVPLVGVLFLSFLLSSLCILLMLQAEALHY